MNRRTFLCGLTLGTLAVPLAAKAQQGAKVHRVGYLSPVSANAPGHLIFLQSLRELGYVEGENILLEERFADGNSSRLRALAADLVRRNVDVIRQSGRPRPRQRRSRSSSSPGMIP
jgi:putative tryptophan/tyrosine transport system substrate-binding protein